VVIPPSLRRRFGLVEGSTVIAEEREDGVLIRPADSAPIEDYSPERIAEFLLGNAVDAADLERAREEVRKLRLDPDAVDHFEPVGKS
jgi:AbrB family looped-hinge helix DNA binding protein